MSRIVDSLRLPVKASDPPRRSDEMKYMIMMFGSAGEMMDVKSPEWIREMIRFMQQLDVDLRASGEMVFNAGLADGSAAKTVRLTDGLPVATDGPYAEAKESLIGYWVLGVASEARIALGWRADRRGCRVAVANAWPRAG